MDPHFQNPRISNLTGSVEHAFARNWIATVTFAWAQSSHLRTGGYGSEEAWYRNFTSSGVDQFGRAILTGVLDDTLASSHERHRELRARQLRVRRVQPDQTLLEPLPNVRELHVVAEQGQRRERTRHRHVFRPAGPVQHQPRLRPQRLGHQHQFKFGGVYDLPMGFTVSATVIAHTGVPVPASIAAIGHQRRRCGEFRVSHNNDRPSHPALQRRAEDLCSAVTRSDQPGFAELDARIQKDFKMTDRYHILLSGDFYNLTNRGNEYSNPDTNATIDYSPNCVSRAPAALGFNCTPLTSLPRLVRNDANPERSVSSTRSLRAARRSRSRREPSSSSDDLRPRWT